jgi:hypothetical protein
MVALGESLRYTDRELSAGFLLHSHIATIIFPCRKGIRSIESIHHRTPIPIPDDINKSEQDHKT